MRFNTEVFKSNLPRRAIIVYAYLYGRVNAQGYCWPSSNCIARECGMSQRTVFRAINDLREAGFIITHKRKRSDGGYGSLLFQFPDITAKSAK